MKKIVIATGGTGGHVYVGAALATELNKYGAVTVFTTSGDTKTLKRWNQYEIHTIGVIGKNIREKLKFPFFFILSFIESVFIILKERPRALIGTGSYPSVTPSIASSSFLIPLFITEIDSVPGIATRFLSFFASRIYICHGEASRYLPGRKVRLVNCPVRELRVVDKDVAKEGMGFKRDLPLIFVFGGSGGARSINNLMVELIPQMKGLQFLLSSGIRDYDQTISRLKRFSHAKIFPYVEDMGLAYSGADLLVCRAGALTMAELVRFKKPAIVIPFPYATSLHQYKNAKILEKMGCIKVLSEDVLSPKRLKREIMGLIQDEGKREEMISCFPETSNGAKSIADDVAKCLGI